DREAGRMGDFVVRSNDKRFESVARIECSDGRTCSVIAQWLARELLYRRWINFRLGRSSRGKGKLYFARPTESFNNGGLKCRHMITLNPELVDLIWHAERKRIRVGFDQLHGRKPALKCIGAYLRLEGKAQLLP